MATLVSKDAYLTLAAVDLSDHVTSVVINDPTDTVEETAMGDDSRKHKPGLYNPGWTIEFKGDFAASSVESTYWSSLRGTTFSAICNPNGSTTSTSNPRYTQTVMVSDFQLVNASIGDLATATMTLVSAGDISRATV